MHPPLITKLLFGSGLILHLWSRGVGAMHSYFSFALLAGMGLMLVGGLRLAQEKGYHRWLGFLSLLGVPGAVILLLLPARRAAAASSGKPSGGTRLVLAALMLFGGVLCRDAMQGREHRWLPAVFEPLTVFGPVLLVVTGAAYLLRLREEAVGNPRATLVANILVWAARGMGILLLLAPFLVAAATSLNRAPGVRPGNEGEGLGLFIVFILCLPPGIALTVVSFLPGPKAPAPSPEPETGRA